MSNIIELQTARNATTNPDPNTLTTPDPIGDSYSGKTASPGWIAQGNKAIFPKYSPPGGPNQPITMIFDPANGAAVTYTATLWRWIDDLGEWVKAAGVSSQNYTGTASDTIENPGTTPWFIQLSSISAGNISLYVDGDLAEVL